MARVPTESELAAIRERARVLPLRDREELHVWVGQSPPCEVKLTVQGAGGGARGAACHALVTHIFGDLLALLSALDERDDLLWRMSQDPGAYQLGQESERRAVLDAIRPVLARCRRHRKRLDMYVLETEVIGVRGVVGPLLPPERLHAEIERLHAEIERLRQVLHAIADAVTRPLTQGQVLEQVRELVWEGLGR